MWDCDPTRRGQGVVRPAMGAFNPEAVAADPVGERLYLTEDRSDGRLYRFSPAYPGLSAGLLEVAVVQGEAEPLREGRSWDSVVRPTAQPPCSVPTRLACGTRASARDTSLNDARLFISRSWRTSAPAWRIGKTRNEMPRCLGTSGSVRANSIP